MTMLFLVDNTCFRGSQLSSILKCVSDLIINKSPSFKEIPNKRFLYSHRKEFRFNRK